jgi:very-short-patch-repair endonuclease
MTRDAERAAARQVRTSALERARGVAEHQAGIVSRRQLHALGVTRGQVRAQVRARRWQRWRTQAIALTTGPLDEEAKSWVAVFEAGPRAHLDGASALVAAGLTGFTVDRIRVSVPRGSRVRRTSGLDIRQTRRWSGEDIVTPGIPRARVETAAVRAALWARSDKQAALLLTMTVQQGLSTPERLGAEMLRIKRDKRRAFIHGVILDLMGGVRSLGELEFARQCRQRGLPEPSRQVVRRGRDGRWYLDVLWERWGLVVEIDGIQHGWAEQVIGDALRQNSLTLDHATVLRLPLLGLRVAPDDFFEQIEAALVAAGCPLDGRRTA